MSDIRLVIRQMEGLSVKVDRLIDDVKDHGGKIDDLRLQSAGKLDKVVDAVGKHETSIDKLRHQATTIKTGLYVAGVALVLFGWFLDHMIDGKLQAFLTTVSAAHK